MTRPRPGLTDRRLLRTAWQLVHVSSPSCVGPECSPPGLLAAIGHFLCLTLPQMANTILLHGFLWGMNLRSRRKGERAARQEEVLLTACLLYTSPSPRD